MEEGSEMGPKNKTKNIERIHPIVCGFIPFCVSSYIDNKVNAESPMITRCPENEGFINNKNLNSASSTMHVSFNIFIMKIS